MVLHKSFGFTVEMETFRLDWLWSVMLEHRGVK